MADDVAVADILCEAMEYLSKLGANLRSRSENLKERRIRKDRLKNSHAVHKAAQKVLTICELSKKSLDNVEIGVKRILSAVSAAQASIGDGGKTTKRYHTSSKPSRSSSEKPSSEKNIDKHLSSPKSVHVSGKKYILKFPRKVNVTHYQSVKVFVRSMPKSFLEKYPVYYNCKLYRSRERKSSRNANASSLTGSSLDSASDKFNETKNSKTLDKVTEKSDLPNSDIDLKEEVADNKYDQAQILEDTIDEKTDDENISKTEGRKSRKRNCERKQSTIELSDSDSSEQITFNKERKERKHSQGNQIDVDDSKEKSTQKYKKDKPKKHKRIIVDSSDSEQDNKISPGRSNDAKSGQVNDEESAKEIPSDKLSEGKASAEYLGDKHSDAALRGTSADKEDNNINNDKFDQVQETDPSKPLIKCVSLTKLLKPDVLIKETKSNDHNPDELVKKDKSKKMLVHMNKKGELRTKLIDVVRSKNEENVVKLQKPIRNVTYKNGEEIATKRKLLADFKPKNFIIKVIKLPTLSIHFLQENNLKRITKNGSIITEILANTSCHSPNSDKKISSDKNANDTPQVQECTNKAKNALLNDSDSESSPKMSKEITTQIADSAVDKCTDAAKNALLNDSDGEKSEVTPTKCNENTNEKSKDKTISEKIKKSLLNDSESDKNEEYNKSNLQQGDGNISKCLPADTTSNKAVEEPKLDSNEDTPDTTYKDKTIINSEEDKELAKSSLLNDSSGSSTKSPEKERKRDDGSTQSRRKHIMESMHAKKMLLTYSSSSDTEDEQLKNTIKNIKDNLLKDIENEDETNKSVKKKLLSSSESDEDNIIKHVKKKRKIAKSKSPSPEADGENKNGTTKSDQEDANMNSHSGSTSEKSNSSRRKMGRSREKPGGSSSQNSDTQDDKDIEGLTNLKSLSKHRRRRGSDSEKAESTRSTTSTRASTASAKKVKMSNLEHIKGEEGLVEAPESSDEASAVESEGQEDEDLPSISLPGLNGAGLEHLAKDDLLDDSESDSSKDKSSDVKKETDSESEALKSRRRKANTISSDSEVGSSRQKTKDARLSDFEDSEDENSEPVKKSKRKKKGSDSDASAGSSSDGGKKKRRRIKTIDSDDVSGSDSENEGKGKHGRKNIRKVMGKNQLEEATKKAAREEKERVARIADRQKMYNNLEFDESGKPDEVILDKVVLDFDPSTKEPLIEVDRGLVKKLKPHQANGIKFMWDACFESVKRIKKDKGSGCILAHCMGLGKTLQVVSLTHTLLTHSDLTKVNRVLVVCPLSTVLNWVNEFKMWLKHAEKDYEVDVYELSKFKQNSERAFQLSSWFTHGGVCVLGYEMFRNLSADNPKKFKKKMLRQFQESLVDPGPDMVVCDEGHLLKNEKTSLSQSMNRVKTLRRIVLTGTPLQNNLKEYYCMVQFVKPNLLGKYNEYLNRFVNPITNGQYTDSTEYDIKIMKRRSHVLHKMLDGAVQRRDYGVLAPFLPPKHEYVLFITLTDVQVKLYQHYLDNYSRRPLAGKSSGFLFPDFQSLQRIWTHPLVLKYNSERYEIMQQKKRDREEEEDSEGSLADFIDDDSTPDETTSEDESDSLSDASDDSRKKKKKKAAKKSKKEDKKGLRRGTRSNPNMELDEVEQPDPEVMEAKNDNPTEWWIPLVTDDEIEDMRHSHKLVLLFEILRQCEAIGDKLLVFSQSLYSLDLIEHFLGKVDEATQEGRIDEKLGGHVGSWSPGIDYFRLDGSTSCENRSIWCKNFNREDNPRARLFLISTRAGGLGINLVAANRVIIFDVSWNPSHDVQSIFRVYRFGQKKPCYIYRFLVMGTMEEKIYERQVTKQAISKRVIDEQQIDRHYAENDLAELYKFEPRPPEPRPVPLVPKDRLFAEMLKEREHVIYKFHEHDSLLENKEEETLSEEERKAAWDDFENEKNRPPPQPFSSWPMHNGMGHMPNLLAAQQQQLAYAALAQMLRKDMPNLSDDNIRAMLPLIYSSNPGLMQKLSSMYTQPGMMNPSMMNPAGMNVGGAQQSGMGGGGTSGLQYEPPWQRQQQHQQQMRLQQLMQQQQNAMGAKFYAGGLGSRDPIAMALQQQRAREIMLGGASTGRPRGRPPLQPRGPPTAPGDVVNLDSD